MTPETIGTDMPDMNTPETDDNLEAEANCPEIAKIIEAIQLYLSQNAAETPDEELEVKVVQLQPSASNDNMAVAA